MGNDGNGNEKNPRSTRMDTDRCPQADNGWRCIVSTDVMFYPQMLDRCYTDFHLFNICGLYWSAGGLFWGTRIMAN